jgi:hypothetical protein
MRSYNGVTFFFYKFAKLGFAAESCRRKMQKNTTRKMNLRGVPMRGKRREILRGDLILRCKPDFTRGECRHQSRGERGGALDECATCGQPARSSASPVVARALCPLFRNVPRTRAPVARREWDRLVGELAALRLLTNLDRATLAASCGA